MKWRVVLLGGFGLVLVVAGVLFPQYLWVWKIWFLSAFSGVLFQQYEEGKANQGRGLFICSYSGVFLLTAWWASRRGLGFESVGLGLLAVLVYIAAATVSSCFDPSPSMQSEEPKEPVSVPH